MLYECAYAFMCVLYKVHIEYQLKIEINWDV